MNTLPQLVPISDIRQRQNELLASLADGPILLTQRGHSAAVLVSPVQWNEIAGELEDLRDALDAAEARQEPGAVDFSAYLADRGESVPAAT